MVKASLCIQDFPVYLYRNNVLKHLTYLKQSKNPLNNSNCFITLHESSFKFKNYFYPPNLNWNTSQTGVSLTRLLNIAEENSLLMLFHAILAYIRFPNLLSFCKMYAIVLGHARILLNLFWLTPGTLITDVV